MYIPEDLKVNRFKQVPIPSNREYFGRNNGKVLPDNLYTGDDVAIMPQNKIDQITEAELDVMKALNDADSHES